MFSYVLVFSDVCTYLCFSSFPTFVSTGLPVSLDFSICIFAFVDYTSLYTCVVDSFWKICTLDSSEVSLSFCVLSRSLCCLR